MDDLKLPTPDVFPDPIGVERLERFERYLNSSSRRPILVTGLPGSGKTVFVQYGFSRFTPPGTRVEFIQLPSRDAAAAVERTTNRIRNERGAHRYFIVIDEADRVPMETIREILRDLYNLKAIRNVILISVANIKIEYAREIALGPPEGKLYGLRDQLLVTQPSIISIIGPQIITVNNTLIQRLKKKPHDVYEISPRQFEELVADLLAGMGMEVELTPATRDGGKDILAYMKTEIGKFLTLVETKQHNKSRPVGVELVRSLFGTLIDHEATSGMLVTTSRFAKPAQQFQERHRYQLSLKDYGDVVTWILKHKENN
jgi:HJR/Mrr/RecB family endonuclease